MEVHRCKSSQLIDQISSCSQDQWSTSDHDDVPEEFFENWVRDDTHNLCSSMALELSSDDDQWSDSDWP
eukprot:9233165-Karenia_brevis.AAC.1